MTEEKKPKAEITDIEVIKDVATDLAEQGADVLAILNQQADRQYEPGLVQFKIVKETAQFTTPSSNDSFPQIVGIILACEIARSLWSTGTDEEQSLMDIWTNGRPICSSRNNNGAKGEFLKPLDDEAPQVLRDLCKIPLESDFICADCPYNEFGSRDRGKMCKEMRRLLLWIPASRVTGVLSLPPSSIRNWQEYRASLSGKHFSNVITKIELEPKARSKKEKYSVAKFTPEGSVSPIDLADLGKMVTYQGREVKEVMALMMEFLNLALDTDYDTNGTENGTEVKDSKDGF